MGCRESGACRVRRAMDARNNATLADTEMRVRASWQDRQVGRQASKQAGRFGGGAEEGFRVLNRVWEGAPSDERNGGIERM
jgi:hypothetical protein